jgi:hypothetical protein
MFMHYVQALIVCQNTDKLNVDKTSISSFPTLDLYPKADKGGPLLGLSGGELPPPGIPASKKSKEELQSVISFILS